MGTVTATVGASNLPQQLDTQDPEGSILGQSPSDKVCLFGGLGGTGGPIVQPASPAGNTHTPAAGSTTAVYVNTTFDGTLGSTAYTIGDIVVALKKLGILAE